MPVLTAANLGLSYGEVVVLEGVSLSIEPGQRIGIVGRNGAGKTTLLRMLAGTVKPDAGEVVLSGGARRGYLEQDPQFDPEMTVIEAAGQAFADLHAAHAELDGLFQQMGDATGDALDKLLKRQAELEKRIEAAGGYAVEHRVEAVLHGLGFSDEQFDQATRGLSGGQRSRLALAKVLLGEPDIVLLDEPTNHLDIQGRLWLEGFLSEEFGGAVAMISHDRRLLDRVVDRIIEVEHTRLVEYPGNYTKFRELRAERREAQLRAYEKQQTQFKREEAFIRKFKAGQRAKQARGRESRLERSKATEQIERPLELAQLRIDLPKADRSGDIVVSVRDLAKRYERDGGELVLFDGLDLQIGRGERWAIVGPNGAGKTTLVRCLLGELAPDRGSVNLGTRLSIGHFRQRAEHLDPERTVVRELQRQVELESGAQLNEQQTRDLAGMFLFSGDDQEKEVGVLSGGERARLTLASLLASSKNLLVLDEPTNHLDIPSAERLERILRSPEDGGTYEGTLILISHDRALIDGTCEHLIVLDGQGGARVFAGTYSEWEAQQGQAQKPKAQRAVQPAKGGKEPARGTAPAGSAASAVPKAGAEKRKSRFSWMRIDQLEERLHELESDVAAIDEDLGRPETWTDATRTQRLTEARGRLKAELEEIEEEWLHRAGS